MVKPVIGVTTDVDRENRHELPNAYIQAVIRAGGLPLIIPIGIEEDVIQVLGIVDGLLLSGGNDINPILFDEEPHTHLGEVSPGRDLCELELARQMLTLDKPILGICRGLQILNVAGGGNLYQDIYNQLDGPILQHNQKAPRGHLSHFVKLEKESILESIVRSEQLKVNSFHHQAVKDVSTKFKVSGVANDGVIEAIEGTGKQFVLGVQWHPEQLAVQGDAVSQRIFEKFIEACTD